MRGRGRVFHRLAAALKSLSKPSRFKKTQPFLAFVFVPKSVARDLRWRGFEKETTMENTSPTESFDRATQALFSRVKEYDLPRVLLEAIGIRQVEFVKKYGFRKADVSECLRGMSRNAKIRAAVAQELGVAIDTLWPK